MKLLLTRYSFIFFIWIATGFQLFGQSQSQFQNAGDGRQTVTRKGQNLVAYDDRLLHYGFFLALNRSGFRAPASEYFNAQLFNPRIRPDAKLYAINPRHAVGFTTGFILNVRIFDLLDVRVLPTVSFYQRFVDFRYQNDSIVTELKQSTFSFVELPILLKFKSQRRNNTRMYMVGGFKPGIEVGSKKSEIQNDRLRSTTFDFAFEYGFGFDFYYPLFKFSPEIRFSHGIINLKNNDPNSYAYSISKLYTHTVTLYLNFE